MDKKITTVNFPAQILFCCCSHIFLLLILCTFQLNCILWILVKLTATAWSELIDNQFMSSSAPYKAAYKTVYSPGSWDWFSEWSWTDLDDCIYLAPINIINHKGYFSYLILQNCWTFVQFYSWFVLYTCFTIVLCLPVTSDSYIFVRFLDIVPLSIWILAL